MRIRKLKLLEKSVIGGQEDPLLIRWAIFRIPAFGVFLHKFCRSDYDRALHDHPWSFISIILRGGYREVTDMGVLVHRPGAILLRPAEWRHRVIIDEKPSWNLILVGRRRRKWGFWVGGEWCWWRNYNYELGICAEEIFEHGNDD